MFAFPSKTRERFLLVVFMITGILLYLARAQRDELVAGGIGAALVLVIFWPAVLLCLLVIVGSAIASVIYALQGKGLLPLLALVVSCLLGYYLPLPPLRATTYFHEHRMDFEAVVQLQKTEGLLSDTENCRADIAYELPKRFQHLTRRCVFVYEAGILEFTPPVSAFSIVYVDESQKLSQSFRCSLRGGVWDTIDENWYVCLESS